MPPRPIPWLPIAGIALLLAAVLGWLLLVFAGNRPGKEQLSGHADAMKYFIDEGGRLSRADVEGLPAHDWKAWPGGSYLMTERGEALWLRVTVRNPSGDDREGILENEDFFQDRIEMWAGSDHKVSGEAVPARQKPVRGRQVAFPVDVPARGETTVLLRMEDFNGAYASPAWWPSASDFYDAKACRSLAEGLYIGGLLALLCYNALLWLRLRQRDIGYYVLYLAGTAVFIFLARSIAPELGWAWGSPGMEIALTVTLALNGFFLLQFARDFLEVRTHLPQVSAWMYGWSILLLALAACSLSALIFPGMIHSLWHIITLTGVTHLGLLALGVKSWQAGVWQARFFLLSFGCLCTAVLLAGFIFFFDNSARDLGMRGLMIGSALEMLVLSLAVADRFARAQEQLVEETEQRRIIEEAYAGELAEEVRERTRELQEANTDKDRMITVIGHDLRSPLTGLMRSADDTPGAFSRDVAHTCRALLLMIEDLVLWSRLRAGTRTMGVHPARTLVSSAVALHRTLAEQSGVALAVDIPEDLRVEADLVLAQTLVRNLLTNGLKFASTQIVLRAREEEPGRVRFTVTNDGPALSAEVADRLASGQDGPITATGGMGLRLCREICQAFGTQLEARIPEGGGTEFGFTLRKVSAEVETAA